MRTSSYFLCVAFLCLFSCRIFGVQDINETNRYQAVLLEEVTAPTVEELLVGRELELDLPEFGAVGRAKLVEIAACPDLERGSGRLVTGSFRHEATNVINLWVEGERDPIGTTANHPFWSEDRHAYVEAGNLKPGELLRTIAGAQTRVLAQGPRGPPETVYNFEVEGVHAYAVGDSGVVVHNTCAGDHHMVPRSMGSTTPYKHPSLTGLSEIEHTALHADLAVHLKKQRKVVGGVTVDMMARRGNSGARVIANFTKTERLKALASFYNSYKGGAYLPNFLSELKTATRNGWIR